MARGRQRTTFDKLARERARLEKQAAKRERRVNKNAQRPGTEAQDTESPEGSTKPEG
jgi:hypothetical protein